MSARRDIAAKGGKALKRTAGVGGRSGRASKPPIEEKDMPDTLMAEATEHRALRHMKGANVPFGAKQRSSSMPSSLLRRLSTADKAFVVRTRWPAHQRICLLQRTEGLPAIKLVGFLARPAVAKMGYRKLHRLANRLNRRNGVSAAAAGAMYLDWRHEYEVPIEPTNPIDWAQFTRDRRAERRARDGEYTSRPVSGGYLRIKGTYIDCRRPIWPGSIRHSWLMAHTEWSWASLHGRVEWVPDGPNTRVPNRNTSKLLRTERAANLVCEKAGTLADLRNTLRQFSKGWERFTREHGGTAEADRIKARRGTPEHRRVASEIWVKGRLALRELLAAIRAYDQARAKLETV